jgi:hypothetical protein
MRKLSRRAERALEILEDGGYFRHALETNYHTRREQFQTRLYDRDRNVVKGFSFKAHQELQDNGLLAIRECPKSSTWPTEYVAKGTHGHRTP